MIRSFDEDGIFRLEVVQVQVALLVRVADTRRSTTARPSGRHTCRTTRSSPSVVTPSVSMTTAASDEPRKSLSTWRMAVPSWLLSCDGSAFSSRIAVVAFSISSGCVTSALRCARLAQR